MILWASANFIGEDVACKDNVLYIEDVEYEELVAGPDCSSYPVAQLIQSNSTMIHHG